MQPGEPLLHQISQLEVQAGTLMGVPEIVPIATGKDIEYGISYVIEDLYGEERTGVMRLRSLEFGRRPGTTNRDRRLLPKIVAGRKGIEDHLLRQYVAQRDKESQPGGIY